MGPRSFHPRHFLYMQHGTKIATIKSKLVEIIKQHPNGIRYRDLKAKVLSALPQANPNTVVNAIAQLEEGKDYVKRVRGVYQPVTINNQDIESSAHTVQSTQDEKRVYAPFASFLVNDLSECKWAIPLGGKKSNQRWTTPDVVGVWRSQRRSHFNILEIVSAEIKDTDDSKELITGFGQACAYRLFSHRVYLVVPGDKPNEEDKSRLEDLCLLYGIGLIFFYGKESNGGKEYEFQIRCRSMRFEPDYYHAEIFLSSLNSQQIEELRLD